MKELLILFTGFALGWFGGIWVYIQIKNREMIDYWRERGKK